MNGMTNGTTNGTPEPSPATFELTVLGAVGPVLRRALRPQTASRTQACTIVRAGVPDTMDLVDLLFLLQANGLKLEGIFQLDA